MSSIREKFGSQAATNSFGPRYENFKVEKPGVDYGPFRIFPPMHSLQARADGWKVYHAIHFGYVVTDANDSTKSRQRPFECIERKNFKTKMIEVSCPECRMIELNQKLLDDRKAEIAHWCKSNGIVNSKEIEAKIEADEKVKEVSTWLEDHNRDGKIYLNVMTLDGKFGVLKIAGKMGDALLLKVKELRDKKGIEPIADFDSGAWFIFRREGTGGQSSHYVSYAEEEVAGFKGATKPKLAPVSDDLLEKALEILPDLATGVTIKLSEESIKLLTTSGNDPDANKLIFSAASRERSPEGSAKAKEVQQKVMSNTVIPTSLPPVTQPSPVQQIQFSPPVQTSQTIQTSPVIPAQHSPAIPAPAIDLQAQIAQLQAQLAQQAAAATKAQTTQPAPVQTAPAVVQSSPAPVAAKPSLTEVLDPNMSQAAFENIFKIPSR